MTNKLLAQLQAILPAEIAVPQPLVLLYDWIEQHGLYTDDAEGQRTGYLFPHQQLIDSWTDDNREGGTMIQFSALSSEQLADWLGGNGPMHRRPHIFAQTGADGSSAALWLNDAGLLKIVHLGSGSGSVLNCVLAENAVDFLRLLAIGYDEICWSGEFAAPPNVLNTNMVVAPNEAFQQWVRATFHVTIPATAAEIVRHPAEYGDKDSGDEFCDWCNRQDE